MSRGTPEQLKTRRSNKNMAEVQNQTQSGEMARRFIEFLLMHSQNAAFFLGQMPNPQTGKPEKNLEMARMFIDQLEMIQEKTRGNLSDEESGILANSLTNLRLAFVQAGKEQAGETGGTDTTKPDAADGGAGKAEPGPKADAESDGKLKTDDDSRGRKVKFSKSYGS